MDFSVLTGEPGSGSHLTHLLKPVFSLLLIKDVCPELAPKICSPMCAKNWDQSNPIGLKLSRRRGEFMSIKAPCVWIRRLLEWRELAPASAQRIQADWEDRDAGSMPLFGISVSVGIPAFFYNIEYLFVNTKTLRTLTFRVGERIF